MIALTNLALAISTLLGTSFQVPACDLVDFASAETLLGEGASEISGGADPVLCQYMDVDGLSLLTVQVTEEDIYDVMGIPEPHTDIDVGERARYSTDENGDLALQFIKGGFHVLLRLVPNPDRPVNIELLKTVARTAADRIP